MKPRTAALVAAFGLDTDLEEPPHKATQANGVPVKGHTRQSPRWQLPAWQALSVPGATRPEGWAQLKSLAHVHEGAAEPYGAPSMIRYREKVERRLRDGLLDRSYRKVFVRRYFKEELYPFHERMLDEAFEGGKVAELVPTEHGKSTLLGVWFPIMSWANDPNLPHSIICSNEPEAKARLRAAKRILESSPELIRDYPWLAKSRRLWGATEFDVAGKDSNRIEASYWAAGRGNAQVKGHRGITVFDDLEGKRSRDSKDFRIQLRQWFMTEAVRAMMNESDTDRAGLIACGTPYSVDSFYFFLAGLKTWRVYRQPYRYNDGRLIWPRMEAKIRDFKADMTPEEFAIAMTLDPTGGDPTVLTMKQIQELAGTLKPMASESETIVTLDPGTQNVHSDYAGIATVRWLWPVEDTHPYFNVYDPLPFHRDIYEQVMECRRRAHRWKDPDTGKPCKVLLEVNGRQKADYGAMFARWAPEIEVVEHWTNELNKMDHLHGLTVIRTLLRHGRLGIAVTDPRDDQLAYGARKLQEEVRDLGQSKEDHICAALWFVYMRAFNLTRYLRSKELQGNYQVTDDGLVLPGRQPYSSRSGASLYFNGSPYAGAGQRRVRVQS